MIDILNDDLCGLLDGLSTNATHDCGCGEAKMDDGLRKSECHFQRCCAQLTKHVTCTIFRASCLKYYLQVLSSNVQYVS
jgi:hypothetical protein